MKTFQTNEIYKCRSLCNYDCVWTYKVIKRTKSTITLKSDRGEVLRCRVKVSDIFGAECCHPLGHFSMSPILRA